MSYRILKILTTIDPFKTAEIICVNALARREYSQAELKQKLNDFDVEIIHAVLNYLVEKNWQSDERFTQQYVKSKSARGDGPLKIKQGLSQRGIATSLAHSVIEEIDWFEIAKNVYAKKYTQPPTTLNEKAKRQRFLAQRGFTFEQINSAMNHEN